MEGFSSLWTTVLPSTWAFSCYQAPGTCFKALEFILQEVRHAFDNFKQEIAIVLSLRHDHRSQHMSHVFQQELKFLGIQSSPSFVRAPESNGVADRFIQTLKEQLLWIDAFEIVEDLRPALQQWRKRYNAQWLVQRHGHHTPCSVLLRPMGEPMLDRQTSSPHLGAQTSLCHLRMRQIPADTSLRSTVRGRARRSQIASCGLDIEHGFRADSLSIS